MVIQHPALPLRTHWIVEDGLDDLVRGLFSFWHFSTPLPGAG